MRFRERRGPRTLVRKSRAGELMSDRPRRWYPDTTPERPDTILSITGAAAVPPMTLATASCQGQSGGQCLSGGPCN